MCPDIVNEAAPLKAGRTLYLHIGRGKTGTSIIQRFLSANSDTLAKYGMHYVFADDAGRGRGHKSFAKTFIERPPDYMRPPISSEAVQEAIATEIRSTKAPNILLSSENFSLANVSRLRTFLENSCGVFRTRIIFFARSQDELAESQYNQLIRTAGLRSSFFEYIRTDLAEMDFTELLSPWAEEFGEDAIMARIFNAATNNAIQDFLHCLPLPDSVTEFRFAAEMENESAGYIATRLYRKLNQFDVGERATAYRTIGAELRGVDLPAIFFNSEQARAFRDQFRESNAAFIRTYIGGSGDDLGGRRFTDDERDRAYRAIRRLEGELSG